MREEGNSPQQVSLGRSLLCVSPQDGSVPGSVSSAASTLADPTSSSSSDYSSGASHVLTVIHDILAHHRALEAKWHAKKIKLHQRLALRLFQEV